MVNTISGTVSRILTGSGRQAEPLNVGIYSYPLVMSLTERGALGVVVDTYGGELTLVNTRTGQVYKRVGVGAFPLAVTFAR